MNCFRSFAMCALSVAALGLGIGCGGGGGGGGGVSCGGAENTRCPAGQFCDYADLSCGATGLQGECKLIPTDCTLPEAFITELSGPVCSCQGLDFFSACDAAAAGQSVRAAGDC